MQKQQTFFCRQLLWRNKTYYVPSIGQSFYWHIDTIIDIKYYFKDDCKNLCKHVRKSTNNNNTSYSKNLYNISIYLLTYYILFKTQYENTYTLQGEIIRYYNGPPFRERTCRKRDRRVLKKCIIIVFASGN